MAFSTTVFWDVTTCSLVVLYQLSEKACASISYCVDIAVCSSAMLVLSTEIHDVTSQKTASLVLDHCEDSKPDVWHLFVLILAEVLLTRSCWADRARTAACQTGCPCSHTESWTASSYVSPPVVPQWTSQSGLHFHTWTHKINTTQHPFYASTSSKIRSLPQSKHNALSVRKTYWPISQPTNAVQRNSIVYCKNDTKCTNIPCKQNT